MARGKIFTNRKQKVAVGEEKVKKSSQPKKKEKKSKGATKEDGHPVGGGDYFDPKTGVVFSTRPQDSCIPLMEANITKFYKEQGQLDNPEDHVTVALHVIDYLAGDSDRPSLVSTIPPVTATDSFNTEEDSPQIMASNDAPITFWQEVKDPKTNHAYYWNPSTNAVSWTLPSNGVLTSEAAERSNEIQDPEREDDTSKVTSVAGVSNGGGREGEFHSVQSKGGKTSKKEEVTKKLKSSDNQRKLESQMLLVSSLSDEITRKLSYLHVDTNKLSELQLLDIKLKTRLEDWKEGALSSQYVLDKLKEIDGKILDIVQKGVSSDWNCLWDRGTCRFFYKHKKTEAVSWEFPTSSDCDDSEDKKDEEMERAEQEEDEEEEETNPTPDLQPQLQNNDMVKEAEEQQLDMEIESVSDEELPQLEDVEATTGNNNNNGNDIQEESTSKEVVTQPSVSLYGDDLPPPYNQEDEEETPPTVDQMVLTELEAANQEALLRACLLEKMKNNTGDKTDGGEEGEQVAAIDWKPPPVTSSLYQEEEGEEEREKEVTRQDRSPSKEKEPEEAPGPVTTTETSKEKRSISPPQDSRDSRHKRVKSESSSKRRSHQYHSDSDYSDERHSRTRRRSRERHTSSSYRSRRSRRYSDDSDGGSRRHGRSHRSRSKGRSRKKKDHRRRHRHGDSSSDEDKGRKRRHRRGNSESSSDDERGKRRHQSSSSEGEKERKETTPPVVSPPINKLSQEGTTGVPPLEKSFVPAKFKPKKAGDEDKNESTLSQTQVEMIHNIASATGYPLVYTMDPQQYGQVTTYGQVAASYANPYGYTSVGGVAYDNYTSTYSTTPTTVEQPTVEPVAMATAESVSTVTTEPVVTSSNGGSATEGNDTKKEEETVIEAAATEKPVSEAAVEVSQDTQNTVAATTDTPPAESVQQDTTQDTAQENESKQEEPVKAEVIKTVEPVRDVTPPLQDPVPTTSQIGYTISAPSTSYPASTYQQGYAPGDQSGAYAAAAAYASYPYYTAAAYDPTQYAAAMNYYAAYQAAAYGAYYQQAGGTQTNGGAMQPPTTKS